MELVDVYNNKHERINIKKDRKKLVNGEFRLSCFVFIINDNGEILIQQRLATAKKCPNMWEVASGGVNSGETSLEGAIREIKEELGTANNEESDEEEEGETMNILLKTALEYLPQLLQKNNNNFQAVGVQAAENPLVKNLVANDPELAQTFFEKAREKYGLENAKKLALGFGFNLEDAASVTEETAED